MLKRKILSKVGIIFSIISILMLFVIPFVLIKIPGTDNKLFAVIYFCIFLVSTAIANIFFEKSDKPVTLDELREEKLNQLLS